MSKNIVNLIFEKNSKEKDQIGFLMSFCDNIICIVYKYRKIFNFCKKKALHRNTL